MAKSLEEKARREVALKIFRSLEDLMVDFWSRWQDEREYEDINDYGKVIQTELDTFDAGAKLVTMSKRPFGFTYTLSEVSYKVTVKLGSYGYKRVK